LNQSPILFGVAIDDAQVANMHDQFMHES
jgi:hypothetical protein